MFYHFQVDQMMLILNSVYNLSELIESKSSTWIDAPILTYWNIKLIKLLTFKLRLIDFNKVIKVEQYERFSDYFANMAADAGIHVIVILSLLQGSTRDMKASIEAFIPPHKYQINLQSNLLGSHLPIQLL